MSQPDKGINLVWFKRDLRLSDHAPLLHASNGNPILLIFIFEPSLMSHADHSWRHWQFIYACLDEMRSRLQEIGGDLYMLYGEAEDVFAYLDQQLRIATVYSHEETGVNLTFDRDKRMKQWFRKQGIDWQEFQSNGVKRGIRDREKWDSQWFATMSASKSDPDLSSMTFTKLNVDEAFEMPQRILNKLMKYPKELQPAGRTWALKYLRSFLNGRSTRYMASISKPAESRIHCSRISPYISYGVLSVRECFQETLRYLNGPLNRRNLQNFLSRLRWHCHFIQKFEMEVEMEFRSVNKALEGLRSEEDKFLVEAWKAGKTGIPLVDACMRCVNKTGYLNFRMRAMLVSFLTHILWQDWKSGVHHLAQQFLDYEPGIHYPQFQMQASMTGVNTIRIYNPIKQAEEHDPHASFIKEWVPELSGLPGHLAREPWSIPPMEAMMYGFQPGVDYPLPVVDVKTAMARARDTLFSSKKSGAVREEAGRILKKHVRPENKGSREQRH